MPPQPHPELIAQAQLLIDSQAEARDRTAAQAAALIGASVDSFDGWYATDRITRWSGDLARQSESLQLGLARLVDAYIARLSSLITGKRVRPAGAIDVSELRTGVSHAGAYARAADVYRWQQSRLDTFAKQLPEIPSGTSAAGAVSVTPPTLQTPAEAARERAEAVADLDSQLVVSRQSQKSYAAQRDVIGYRRVLHPELARTGSCGLCVAASTVSYHKQDLLPIHARCSCTTAPVYDAADVGDALNAIDLEQIYRDAGAHPKAERAAFGRTTFGRDLKRVRYQVDDHGELGPILNPHGVKVRTAADVKRDENGNRRPLTEAQKRQRLQRIHDDLANALPRARALAATSSAKQWPGYVDHLEQRIADLKRQLS
jgi:hypothetical protein